jgi:dienelactone hydrolase
MRATVATLLFLLAIAGVHAQSPGPVGSPEGPWREQIHWVPMQDARGGDHLLYTRICRPQGDRPARLVVINHGSPPDRAARSTMQPPACDAEAVQWFLSRGYAVAAAMRRAHGKTGGYSDEESMNCSAEAYATAGREGARDADAVVTYAAALPFVQPDHVVVVGQSTGGWVSDAYDSLPHPKVTAIVSMAGGRGGHFRDTPNTNCRPDQLAAAAGLLGKTATTPMLWIYTENDSFFAPDLAKAMYDQFTAAGGKAAFHQLPAFAKDGHTLFFGKGGSAIWGPLIEAYINGMR